MKKLLINFRPLFKGGSKNCSIFGALGILLVLSGWGIVIAPSWAAELAIIDFADQWTQVEAVAPTMDKLKIKYDNITKDVIGGSLPLKDEHKMLFICSMATNNANIHQNLDKNDKVIQAFVKRGGVVLEPTQADQNEANVDWLPPELSCVRSDPDKPNVKILKPNHNLFNTPNKIREPEFTGWGHQGWPTVWEVIASQKGFEVLMETDGLPAVMEAKYGNGMFVMMCLAPDKYHVKGNDDNTKAKAFLFMQNVMQTYFLDRLAVESRGKLAASWATMKRR